jgi:hypothetical protein
MLFELMVKVGFGKTLMVTVFEFVQLLMISVALAIAIVLLFGVNVKIGPGTPFQA